MELWLLFGTFTALLLIGTPVAFCLGAAALAALEGQQHALAL